MYFIDQHRTSSIAYFPLRSQELYFRLQTRLASVVGVWTQTVEYDCCSVPIAAYVCFDDAPNGKQEFFFVGSKAVGHCFFLVVFGSYENKEVQKNGDGQTTIEAIDLTATL